jgi:hypothetical protein
VLKFGLVWVDNSREQLLQLRGFLISRGIALGNVLRHSTDVYRLQVGSPRFVLVAAKLLMSVCFKKREELRIVIDYYEDKITGTQAISRINEQVRLSYHEGIRTSAKARGKRAAETRLAKLHKWSSRL